MKHLLEINDFAACPLDAPATRRCEAEHPRKAAPVYAFQELNFADARPFVEQFHYLHKIGGGAFIFFGAFVEGELQVVACLGQCANKECPKDFIELKRLVARPESPVRLSQFLAQTALTMKQRNCPALVSWADPDFGHHGGIYQAANWTHTETRKGHNQGRIFVTETGERIHARTISSRYGTADVSKVLALHPRWKAIRAAPKFRYLLPLNMRLKKCCELMRTRPIPYPKGVPTERWRFNRGEWQAKIAKMTDAELQKEHSHNLNYVPNSPAVHLTMAELKKRKLGY